MAALIMAVSPCSAIAQTPLSSTACIVIHGAVSSTAACGVLTTDSNAQTPLRTSSICCIDAPANSKTPAGGPSGVQVASSTPAGVTMPVCSVSIPSAGLSGRLPVSVKLQSGESELNVPVCKGLQLSEANSACSKSSLDSNRLVNSKLSRDKPASSSAPSRSARTSSFQSNTGPSSSAVSSHSQCDKSPSCFSHSSSPGGVPSTFKTI